MTERVEDMIKLKEQAVRQLVEAIKYHARGSVENPMLENQILHVNAVGTLTHAIEVLTY